MVGWGKKGETRCQMLQVENLTARVADFTYSDVSMHVDAGQTYGILGDGKSGKTEWLQLLSGMRSPDRGTVKVADCHIHHNIRRAQQHVSVLPRTLALFPALSVEDNLLFWGRLYDIPSGGLLSKMDRVLRLVNYEEGRGEQVAALSALDQKRVHLAAALLHEPEVLMLDQPTEQMNASERETFLEVVQQLQHYGQTMVYATDKVDEIQHVAMRVAILDQGNFLAEGTVDALRGLLGGQSQIVVRCRPLEALVRRIEAASMVHTVDEGKRELRIWTKEPKELLARLFSDWQQNEIVTESVRVVEPTLAGVYLHLTGKSLDE